MKRKRFLSFLMVLLLLPSLLLFTPVKAKEEKVIKVGFPSFQNLSEVDEKGNPSGYLYDYLKEIAKYTGWKLEFVTADNSNADILNLNDMLANGEIDLMGGMIQNEATSQLYDFPEYDCGFSYATLQVLQNNEKYDFLDYQSLNGMRVGTLRNAANIQKSLDDFCELNDIEVEKVLFDTQADILNALESGQIDALLLKDLGLEPERRIVAKFAGTPFYFAVPKGRTDLIRELNSAMDRILNIDPYFSTKLYHKYFAGTSTHVFFSEEEKAYLAKTAEVKVAILENDRPFGYLENGEWHGISFDFLKYVSQNTGLQFTFVKAKDETEALRMVRDGEADLFASARLHEALHQDKDLMFTATYLSTQNILVKNKKVTETDLSSSRLALPQGVVVSSDLLNENHTYYPTLKDCIDAVNSGKADYTYGNSYSIEQIIRRPAYQNLLLVPMNDSGLQFAMAMSSQADTSLLNLLNKAIATVPNSTLQTLIFENTAKSGNDISLFDFIASHPTESILIISLFSLIVILIIAALAVVRLRHARQEALSDERYRILENITGEYVFEYDIEKDSMSYSEKYANDFGKSRVVKNYAQDHSPSAMRFKELVIQKLHTEAFPSQTGKHSVDFDTKGPDGSATWMRVVYTVQYDQHGHPLRLIGKLFDIAEEREERERLIDQSQKDQMTGLYNHAYCEQRIAKYLESQREDAYGAFLLIDIDHFKDINDRLGHRAGDEVLKKLSSLMLALFRSEDVLGRWGGDEFVVFMQDIRNAKVAEERARSLCSQISKVYNYKGASVFLSLSIGISIARQGDTLADIYERADRALYQVKQNGRNNFQIDDRDRREDGND